MSASTTTPNQPISSQSDTDLQAQLLGITPTVKPTSRIGAWLSRLFVIMVLIAIPSAYHFGYIGFVSLNRLGIILNFCAGFMLAPELLGVQRIRNMELRAKHAVNFILNTINSIIRKIIQVAPKDLLVDYPGNTFAFYYCLLLAFIFVALPMYI